MYKKHALFRRRADEDAAIRVLSDAVTRSEESVECCDAATDSAVLYQAWAGCIAAKIFKRGLYLRELGRLARNEDSGARD